MKIEGDVVIFKSKPYYFKQERDGLKPNTERLLTHSEMLLIKPDEETLEIEHIKRIRIECTITDKQYVSRSFGSVEPFERKLTSIEKVGELCGYYLYVFSWSHPFFVDEVNVLKEAIDDVVSNPETKRRIYVRASELIDEKKKSNRKRSGG